MMRIGLEVHVQLRTRFKLFSRALVDESVDFMDWGCPGVLPMLNEEALKAAFKACKLLKCTTAEKLCFDRKHYKHHDMPLGYQITQKRIPIGRDGFLESFNGKWGIKHVQLEQDTCKTIGNTIDFRRSGNGLLEVVTDPIFTSVNTAQSFCRDLTLVLKDAGVTEGRLEDGHVRFDVNVSFNDRSRFEVKNLNSYAYLEMAVKQLNAAEHNGKTLRFCQKTKKLIEMREKRAYFYLPEPDIPDNCLSEMDVDIERTRFELLRDADIPFDKQIRLLSVPKSQFDFFYKTFARTKNFDFCYKWIIQEGLTIEPILEALIEKKISRRQALNIQKADKAGLAWRIPIAREPIQVLEEQYQMDVKDPHKLLGALLEHCPLESNEAKQLVDSFLSQLSCNKTKQQ